MCVRYCSCAQQPGLNVLWTTGKPNSDFIWKFMKMQLNSVTGLGWGPVPKINPVPKGREWCGGEDGHHSPHPIRSWDQQDQGSRDTAGLGCFREDEYGALPCRLGVPGTPRAGKPEVSTFAVSEHPFLGMLE